MKTNDYVFQRLILCVVSLLSLAGCTTPTEEIPTPTLLAPTSTQTSTAAPTLTPTITPPTTPLEIVFQERTPLLAAGFSFMPIMPLHTELAPYQVTLSNTDATFLMSIASAPDKQASTLEQEVAGFISSMSQDVPDLMAQTPVEVEVGGYPALSTDLTGTLFGETFTGRLTVTMPDTGIPVFALALSMDPPVGAGWEAEGLVFFEAVIETLEFFEPSPQLTECNVSTDPTYGYQKDNPIRVGGGSFGGPSRERAYLDVLVGPDGQTINYTRTGSLEYGNTILDEYVLTYDGLSTPITIYIDEYSFSTLMAPVGLACSGPFPVMPE